MSMRLHEPKSAAAVKKWVEKYTQSSDRFAHIAAKYEPHREQHGCYDVYPFANGPLLGTLAAATRPKRLLEVGCGLGYSGLWLAFGAGPRGILETIDCNEDHTKIAREHFVSEKLGRRIKILLGRAGAVLRTLKGRYDLIYFDTDPAESLIALEQSERLLRHGGLLISANLFLGQYAPDLPGLDKTAEYRLRILDTKRWLTAYLPDGIAISIRR